MIAAAGRPVLIDSGPLYALFDRDDAFNGVSRSWFTVNRRPLVTNAAVVTEVTYLLGRWCGIEHQLALLEFLCQPGWTLEHLAPDLPRIAALMDRYRNLPADFTDASLVALAERLDYTDIATTDRRDFSLYRPAHVERLTNLLLPA
jgi:uncharacterized protein